MNTHPDITRELVRRRQVRLLREAQDERLMGAGRFGAGKSLWRREAALVRLEVAHWLRGMAHWIDRIHAGGKVKPTA